MPTITQHKIFLQYPSEGEPGIFGRPTHASDSNLFVDIDRYSGGYPYSTSIERAHNFKTREEAEKYRGHWNQLKIVEVTVTYNW